MLRINGKGLTQGWVTRTGTRERRWKGAYMDFNREDFSRKGTQRGKLKIPGKGVAERLPLFFCVIFGVVTKTLTFLDAYCARHSHLIHT
jgi:hypothetical protein